VCYLRKDIIWDSRTTNNKKETKRILLCQHLFLFFVGGIATCFNPTFSLLSSRFLLMQQLAYNNGRALFSTWSVPRCYKQATGLGLSQNLVPRSKTGRPCSWRIWIRGPGPPGSWSLKSDIVKFGHESRWTRTWEWLGLRGPAAIVHDRPILSSERMLHKEYDRKGPVEKNLWSWASSVLLRRKRSIIK
jgi:hypothetical protein